MLDSHCQWLSKCSANRWKKNSRKNINASVQTKWNKTINLSIRCESSSFFGGKSFINFISEGLSIFLFVSLFACITDIFQIRFGCFTQSVRGRCALWLLSHENATNAKRNHRLSSRCCCFFRLKKDQMFGQKKHSVIRIMCRWSHNWIGLDFFVLCAPFMFGGSGSTNSKNNRLLWMAIKPNFSDRL